MRVQTIVHQSSEWSAPIPDCDGPDTLVVVFGAPEYRSDIGPIKRLLDAFPTSHVIGCSTAGEIAGTEVLDDSLSVAVIEFERTSLRSVWVPLASDDDGRKAGRSIGEQLAAEDLVAVVVLSCGLDVNGTELSDGLTGALPEGVVVTGGLAGDGPDFVSTWVIAGGSLQSDAVVAVGLYGAAVDVTYGSQGGWDIFGPERVVTSSEGNELLELDGRPALDLYEEYLGELASQLPAAGLRFPLAVRETGTDRQLVRTILAIDSDRRSLTFAGDIPEGTFAQLMQANHDRLVDGAAVAAEAAHGGDRTGDALALAISCVGRRLVLGDRVEEETEATLDTLGPDVHQIGFYSYGELAPTGFRPCELHNQTMTLTVISETIA